MFSGACGRCGAGDSNCSTSWLRRSISAPISSISSCSSPASARAWARRDSSCAAPLSPASGLRSSWAMPLSAACRAAGSAWAGSVAAESSAGCASSSQPSAVRVSQPSACRGASPGIPSGIRCRRSTSRSSWARNLARASPSSSSAASGWPTRRRTPTPIQRGNAGLTPVIRPWRSAQASGVASWSRAGTGAGDGLFASIAPI